jgi:hypothetical protein
MQLLKSSLAAGGAVVEEVEAAADVVGYGSK